MTLLGVCARHEHKLLAESVLLPWLIVSAVALIVCCLTSVKVDCLCTALTRRFLAHPATVGLIYSAAVSLAGFFGRNHAGMNVQTTSATAITNTAV